MKLKNKILVFIVVLVVFISTTVWAFYGFSPSPSTPDGMQTMGEDILGAVQFAGYAIAMGMLIYIGIKYVTSSADGKADLKKDSINYVIGVIIIVSCSTLFGAIVKFVESAKGKEPANPPGGGGASGYSSY